MIVRTFRARTTCAPSAGASCEPAIGPVNLPVAGAMNRLEQFAREALTAAPALSIHGPSIKWPHLYEILRKAGHSKTEAARISNAAIKHRKNGRLVV